MSPVDDSSQNECHSVTLHPTRPSPLPPTLTPPPPPTLKLDTEAARRPISPSISE